MQLTCFIPLVVMDHCGGMENKKRFLQVIVKTMKMRMNMRILTVVNEHSENTR